MEKQCPDYNMQSNHFSKYSHVNPRICQVNPRICQILSRFSRSKDKTRFSEPSESPLRKPGHLNPKGESESNEEDSPSAEKPHLNNNSNISIGWRATIELASFPAVITVFVSTLVIPSLEQQELWGLKYWKWVLMLFVILCHRLITVALWIVVFLIKLHFPLHLKVLYPVYELKKSVCHCMWIALVLLSWHLIFHDLIKNPACIHHISRILIAILVAFGIWFSKILLVSVLASNFYEATFLDRMKKRFFHHYILQALDSDPLTEQESSELEAAAVAMAVEKENERRENGKMNSKSQLEKFASLRIHRERMKMNNTNTAWHSVRRLMSHMMKNGLSTLDWTVHGTIEFWKGESEITSEKEVREYATNIFKKVTTVSQKKEEATREKEFIEKEDLSMFLTQGEMCMILPRFKGHLKDGKITKSSFQDWMVEAYQRHKALDYALADTKKVVKNLDRLTNVFAFVIIIITSFIVMGVPIRSVLLVSSSQLLLFGFIFQNTCKIMFESIIFVFVMHPFDIGDHCVIDGVQMTVEEMNILSTVFLGLDKGKIQYPNTELLTKTISNYSQSPHMDETIEFVVDDSTLMETVDALRKSIQEYLEREHEYWHSKYLLLVKEIDDKSQMKMNLHVTSKINFKNFSEKNKRRSDLYFELKKSLKGSNIKDQVLPEVHRKKTEGI